MPFAYFNRLTRRQQAIYLESDGIVTMPLPQAPRVQPPVTSLAAASPTRGFYARESHLFHQLVTDGGILMASLEEQMARMAHTADDFAAAIKGVSDAALTRRPDDKSWSAKETLCHVRDIEESFMARFQSIMEMDEPRFIAAEPDPWPTHRQYQPTDAGEPLPPFLTPREHTLRFLH